MSQIAPGKLAYYADLGMVYAIVDLGPYSVKALIPQEVLATISKEGGLQPDEVMEIANRYAGAIAEAVQTRSLAGNVDVDGTVTLTVNDLTEALQAAKEMPANPPTESDASELSIGPE